MPKETARRLELFGLWTFISVLACCFSVAYMTFIATRVWILSLAAFFFFFFSLYLIQLLLITTSFIELETSPRKIQKWKPTRARLTIFILIGLLFSQPLVFFYKDLTSDITRKVSTSALKSIQKNVEERIDLYEAEKKLAILQKQNILSQLNGGQEINVNYENRKKALIIFNEETSSLEDYLANNLEKAGFLVSKHFRVDQENLNLSFEHYKQSLNAGDISLIYYVGKYKMENGKPLLLPVNYQTEGKQDLQSFASSLTKRKLFASFFILNLIDEKNTINTSSEIKIQPPTSSLFFITNGMLDVKKLEIIARSFLKKFLSDSRVDDSFIEINQDVSKYENLHTILINNLKQNSFYINQPKQQKELSNEELSKILPENEYCANFSNFKERKYLTQCLNFQINSIQRGIDFFEKIKHEEKRKIDSYIQYKHDNPFVLLTYFNEATERKAELLFYTLIATFFISGGFILRDLGSNSVDLYERLSYSRNRINVLLDFKEFRAKAKRLRTYLTGGSEKVAISNFPRPFKVVTKEKLKINTSSNAAEDFYQRLKSKLDAS